MNLICIKAKLVNIIDKVLNRGVFDYQVTDQDIVYYKWNDNQCVNLLSNYHIET